MNTTLEETRETISEEQTTVWAVVELMGHVRLAGKLTEEEHYGVKMGRLDIPHGDGFTTQFFGGSAVYRITIVAEPVARHVARQTAPAPVQPWDFPKALPHVATADRHEDDEDRDEDDIPY